MLTTQAMAGLWLGPAVEVLKPVPDLAAAIKNVTPSETPVATFAFAEPSLIFYLGRPRVEHLPSREAVVGWARDGIPGVLVIPRQELGEILTRHGELPLTEIAASSGLNISNGDGIELVALARRTRVAQ
jgi:hypothetical protein